VGVHSEREKPPLQCPHLEGGACLFTRVDPCILEIIAEKSLLNRTGVIKYCCVQLGVQKVSINQSTYWGVLYLRVAEVLK